MYDGWQTDEPFNRFDKIDDRLWIGAQPDDLSKDLPEGTTRIVSLSPGQLIGLLPDKIVRLYVPFLDRGTADESKIDLEKLKSRVDLVRTLVDDERHQTYVHCVSGVSRTGLVAAAYFMQKYRLTKDEAISRIRKYRMIDPNKYFLQLLDEWQWDLTHNTGEIR